MTAPDTELPLVVLVDDDPHVLNTLTILCKETGRYRVRAFGTAAEAVDALGRLDPDVVVTDLVMEGREAGFAVIAACRAEGRDIPVILMSAHADRTTLARAVQPHVCGFAEKPFRNQDILEKIRTAVERAQVFRRATPAPSVTTPTPRAGRSRRSTRAAGTGAGQGLVGVSPAFQATRALIERMASVPSTVLLTGESGVGKGAFAAYLHAVSSRSAGPFVSVNCGAVPDTLFESTLFGHVKGAFTGAVKESEGLATAASGGTLFLDEIGELSPENQVKLLRFLQYREVMPVGGNSARTVDVRIVTATNRDLAAMVRDGTLRPDLFWRLHVLVAEIPALRQRPEDIPPLADHALAGLRARGAAGAAEAFAPAAIARLVSHDWPGNVRELENVLERAVLTAGREIQAADIVFVATPTSPLQAGEAVSAPEFVPVPTTPPSGLGPEWPPLAQIERAYVHYVVGACAGDIDRAASRLEIPAAAVRAILAGPPAR